MIKNHKLLNFPEVTRKVQFCKKIYSYILDIYIYIYIYIHIYIFIYIYILVDDCITNG